MQKFFTDFSEIEDDVKRNVPSVLYKYRDWGREFHKEAIIGNSIWLASPKGLNDSHDIRIPVEFDITEVKHPFFFEKLKTYAVSWFPNLPPDSRDFQIACEKKLESIKLNPKEYFENSYKKIVESDMYDHIGVFSMTANPVNVTMWAYYANDSNGFCIGYDAIELLRNLKMSFRMVEYIEKPFVWSFITTVEEDEMDWLFQKHTKWSHEEEFRVVNMGIKNNLERKIKLSDNAIKEIIVGQKMPQKDLDEIVDILRINYDSRISLLK